MSTASFEILREIANTKISAFGPVQANLEEIYDNLIQRADLAKQHPVKELRILYEGLRVLAVAQTRLHPDVKKLKNIVVQLEADPSMRPQAIQYWIDKLRIEISQGRRRARYALLFGKILAEHAEKGNSSAADHEGWESVSPVETNHDAHLTHIAAESTARNMAEKLATKQEFCERVLADPPLELQDASRFIEFLNTEVFHFTEPTHVEFIEELRKSVTKFGESLKNETISSNDVKHCIRGLIAADLLDKSRLAALREIQDNDVVHSELASVLNMKLTNFESWTWPNNNTVKVEFRRAMNGKYRAYMDQDIITGLFLQWAGVTWSVKLRDFFQALRSSLLWSSRAELARNCKLGKEVQKPSSCPNQYTISLQRKEFMDASILAQLPACMADQATNKYEIGDDEVRNSKKCDSAAGAIKHKQKLLHFLATEALFHRETNAGTPFVVVKSDFEWFGPSLSHAHLLALLEFFGVPPAWINFFKAFLNVQLDIEGESTPRPRKRGVPVSHALSILLGESLLFALDFYMVQTGGAAFLRLHDDIWMWSSSVPLMANAWRACTRFADVAGLRFNQEKSGHAILHAPSDYTLPTDAMLPQGDVTWGVLRLNESGSWVIDLASSQKHIDEFRARLAAASTVITWCNTYNKYMRFFYRNSGTVAYVSGAAHAKSILDAMTSIHRLVFPEHEGSVIRALAHRIVQLVGPSFGDVIDAWVYWPLAAGGLELWNPYMLVTAIRLVLTRPGCTDYTGSKNFSILHKEDLAAYNKALQDHRSHFMAKKRGKHQFDQVYDFKDEAGPISNNVEAVAIFTSTSPDNTTPDQVITDEDIPPFKPFDEWISPRRTSTMPHWNAWYMQCMREVKPKEIRECSAQLEGHLATLEGSPHTPFFNAEGMAGIPCYWAWILATYGELLLQEFGTLAFIPPSVVPQAMIERLRTEKVKFDV